MAEEYYIRGEGEETARGPYNIDQLVTLAEAGQIQRETLFYDQSMQTWLAIAANQALLDKVFPAKKKLILKKKEAAEAAADDAPQKPAIHIQELLAAAEGNTKETRYVRELAKWRERAASLSVPILGSLLGLSALSMIYPSWNVVDQLLNDPDASYFSLFKSPIVLLGLLDLIFAVLVFLNALEVFPLIRLRAMVGSGFFATLYFAAHFNGDPHGAWLGSSVAAFGAGLFICTLTLNFRLMVAGGILGAAGIAGIAWFGNLVPLFFGAK